MELRIQKLEEFAESAREEFRALDVRLARIETRLEELKSEIKAEMKADLAELSVSMIKWIVGTMLAGGAVAISVMTFVLNNAVPKPANLPQQQPINITLPQAQAPPVPFDK